jgi:hypothetical protein
MDGFTPISVSAHEDHLKAFGQDLQRAQSADSIFPRLEHAYDQNHFASLPYQALKLAGTLFGCQAPGGQFHTFGDHTDTVSCDVRMLH